MNNEDDTPRGVTTMIRSDLTGTAREQAAAIQARQAEQALAPALKVMRETGLIDDGYTAALLDDEHMIVTWDLRDVPAPAQACLARARETIRDRADLRGMPPFVLVLNHSLITVLGDPLVGSVATAELLQRGMELR